MHKYIYNPRGTSSNETQPNKAVSKKSSRWSQGHVQTDESCFCFSQPKKAGTVIAKQLENLKLQRKLYREAVEREKALYDPYYAFSYSYQSQYNGNAPEYHQQYLDSSSQFEGQAPEERNSTSHYGQFPKQASTQKLLWNSPQSYKNVNANGLANSLALNEDQFEDRQVLPSDELPIQNYQEYRALKTQRHYNKFQSNNTLDYLNLEKQPLPLGSPKNLLSDVAVGKQADAYQIEQMKYLDFKKKERSANQSPADIGSPNGLPKDLRHPETQSLGPSDHPVPKLVEDLNPNKIADLKLFGCTSQSFQGIIKYVCWKDKYGFFQITSEEGVQDVFFHFDDFVLSGIMVELIMKFKKLNIVFDFDRLHYYGQQKMRIKAVNIKISSNQPSRAQKTQVLGPPQRIESTDFKPISKLKQSNNDNNNKLEEEKEPESPLLYYNGNSATEKSTSKPTTKDTNDSSSN